ncbi:MAG: hypothetical protein NTY30_04460 [Candidatus Berkelbacteria bacterium]|nr:hypothetical protein [Candidatus Berkelbacteria bacterium]
MRTLFGTLAVLCLGGGFGGGITVAGDREPDFSAHGLLIPIVAIMVGLLLSWVWHKCDW